MDIQKLKQSIKIQDKQDMKDVSILYLIDRLEKAEAQLETATRAIDNLSAERDALPQPAKGQKRGGF